MTALQRIRKENEGQPAREVIRDYAEMGYSKRSVAKNLGISRSTLASICARFDLDKHFDKSQSELRPECRGGGKGMVKGHAFLGRRNPILHAGNIYHPGEPMHHYLWEKGMGKRICTKYSQEEMLEAVRTYPDVSLFKAMSGMHIDHVYMWFGSFSEAKRQAGVL